MNLPRDIFYELACLVHFADKISDNVYIATLCDIELTYTNYHPTLIEYDNKFFHWQLSTTNWSIFLKTDSLDFYVVNEKELLDDLCLLKLTGFLEEKLPSYKVMSVQ